MRDNLYETGIRPIMDDYFTKRGQEVRDYGKYWSASNAGYCMRKVIFDRLKVPATSIDARKQRVFESGHIFHQWHQARTVEAGISIAQEIELIDDKLMIKGHIDDLVKVNDNLILYDYKTQNSGAFTRQKKTGKGMSHYHRMQLGTYMMMLRNGDYPELKEGRIFRISRDDLRQEEGQLMWNAGLQEAVHEYWSTLSDYWKAQTIPKCTCAEIEPNTKTGIGFMANPKYNPYYFNGEPCSMAWYKLFKEGKTDGYIKTI